MGTITDTSAKCNTNVNANICGTKCNNWSYPGNSAICVSRVYSLILSAPTLCLKDPLMSDDNLFGTFSDGRGDSLKQMAWVLPNQSQEKKKKKKKKSPPLTIKNHLLVHISVIYLIYINKNVNVCYKPLISSFIQLIG